MMNQPPLVGSFEDTWKKAQSIDGWFGPAEARLLFDLASKCSGRGVIVEIGSYCGRSTLFLAKGALNGATRTIYSIDPHLNSLGRLSSNAQTFLENMKANGVDAMIRQLVKTSGDAVDDVTEPIELLFIDGDHTYEGVKSDLLSYLPKVVEGGCIAFHDTILWDGCRQLIDEIWQGQHGVSLVDFGDGTTVTRKVSRPNRHDHSNHGKTMRKKFAAEALFFPVPRFPKKDALSRFILLKHKQSGKIGTAGKLWLEGRRVASVRFAAASALRRIRAN